MDIAEICGAVVLKRGREKPVRQGHPWLFSGAIASIVGEIPAGGLVEVRAADGTFLAVGYFNRHSQIWVRLLSRDPAEPIDRTFWRLRLEQALAEREAVYRPGENEALRLVNAESDYLPGLVVDRYADFLVMQCLTAGIDRRKDLLAELLGELLPAAGIYERSDVAVRKKEGLRQQVGRLSGAEPPARLEVKLAGVAMIVDVRHGHKTGLYLDQRQNYEILRRSAVFAGSAVLNLFSYSGGFGLHAVAAGARSVIHVDSSIPALEEAEANVALNGWTDRAADEYLAGDVFAVLRHFVAEGRRFDTVILDPPKFAQSQGDVPKATRGYKDLNRLAFQLIRPGGTLATFSCSGLVSADLFQKVVFSALIEAGREAQIQRWLHQAGDHPVSLTFPEGAYLKGLMCRVL